MNTDQIEFALNANAARQARAAAQRSAFKPTKPMEEADYWDAKHKAESLAGPAPIVPSLNDHFAVQRQKEKEQEAADRKARVTKEIDEAKRNSWVWMHLPPGDKLAQEAKQKLINPDD